MHGGPSTRELEERWKCKLVNCYYMTTSLYSGNCNRNVFYHCGDDRQRCPALCLFLEDLSSALTVRREHTSAHLILYSKETHVYSSVSLNTILEHVGLGKHKEVVWVVRKTPDRQL